jgi:glycerophosphoryl diester phosphodiesterase
VEQGILVCGHRGARAVFPENTLPAFEYAIAVGAGALEMDVAVTRDEVVVVSHDAKLNPAICQSPGGPRLIRELTLAEVQRWDCGTLRHRRFPQQQPVPGARIPTLDQVLSLAGRGQFQFNIEIKMFPKRPDWAPAPGRFAELVYEAIERHGIAKRVVVQCFDFRALHAMAALSPAIRRAALYAGRPASLVRIAERAGASIVAPYHRLATRRRVARAHAAGLQVVPWTANRPRDWRRLIAAEVDGIITDDPAGLLSYLQRHGAPSHKR